LKICPVCGYSNPDDTVFCERCGSMINQSFTPNPALNTQGITNPQSFDPRTQDALSSLKSALFWIFIGMILGIIPFVDFAGIIILIIGAIKLIIALNKISKTSLPSAEKMKRARDWLIVNFVTEIVLVVTALAFFILLLTPIYASISSTTHNPLNNSTVIGINKMSSINPATSWLLIVVMIMEIIVFISTFAFYFSFGNGLQSLGNDIRSESVIKGGKRIITATILLLISAIGSFVLIGGLIISVIAKQQALSILASSLLIIILVPALIAIIGYIILLIGIYSSYSGLKISW
jgi:hypothetical protein